MVIASSEGKYCLHRHRFTFTGIRTEEEEDELKLLIRDSDDSITEGHLHEYVDCLCLILEGSVNG